MTLSHEELRSLLAASALNALPPDEAELLDRHLKRCSHCRTELSEFQTTASLLVEPAPEPPPGLWDEIVKSIELQPEAMPQSLRQMARQRGGTRQSDVSHIGGARRGQASRRSWWVKGWATAAAAALVAVIVLAVSVANLNGDMNHLRNQAATSPLQAAVNEALAAPHRLVDLRSTSGVQLAQAVITPSGTAYLVPRRLDRLTAEETYQLWALSKGQPVSLGVLGPSPGVAAFRVEAGMTALMLTAEPAGGVPRPTSSVLASGNVST